MIVKLQIKQIFHEVVELNEQPSIKNTIICSVVDKLGKPVGSSRYFEFTSEKPMTNAQCIKAINSYHYQVVV